HRDRARTRSASRFFRASHAERFLYHSHPRQAAIATSLDLYPRRRSWSILSPDQCVSFVATEDIHDHERWTAEFGSRHTEPSLFRRRSEVRQAACAASEGRR